LKLDPKDDVMTVESNTKDLEEYSIKVRGYVHKKKYSSVESILNKIPLFNNTYKLEVKVRSKRNLFFISLEEFLRNAKQYLFKDFSIEIRMSEDIEDEDLEIFGKEEYRELKARMCFTNINGCENITSKGIKNLNGIHTLNIVYESRNEMYSGTNNRPHGSNCIPLKKFLEYVKKCSIKDSVFRIKLPEDIEDEDLEIFGKEEYRKLKKRIFLDIGNCPKITDKAWQYLKGIYGLNIIYRQQNTIYKALKELSELLKVEEYSKNSVFRIKLPEDIRDEDLKIFGEEKYKELKKRIFLYINCCNITDEAFKHLKGIRGLHMSGDSQKITDKIFKHLKGICYLNIGKCSGIIITKESYWILHRIPNLDMNKLQINTRQMIWNTIKSIREESEVSYQGL